MTTDEARVELERLRLRVQELEQIVSAGKPTGVLVPASFGLDARERLLREAEQIARMGSFAWDVTTDAIHWSDELYRILGYAPGSVTPTQERFFAAIDARDRERVQEVARRGVTTGATEPVDFRIVTGDGATRNVHMIGFAVPDGNRRPSRFVGVILDVTLRFELEAQRLQSRNMEALGKLAGAMAHDFNNLLTVIGVHAALLRRRRDGIELVEVATAVERAAELTRQLVAFSRRALREATPTDPSTIVRDAAAVARRIVEDDVVAAPPAETEVPSVPPTSQGKGHLILLVEDNGAIRRVLTTILIEAGFRVEAAADAETALGLYLPRPREFAALVTDVVMPGMGGPQLVRQLRGVTPRLPVLYLSGYAREKAGTDEGDTRGALLKKPFLPAELVDKVVELVDHRARD